MLTLIIFIFLSSFNSMQTGTHTIDYVPDTSEIVIMNAEETGNNETKIEFPSFAYRVNLLIYFVIPVLLLVILLLLKIHQLNREESNENHTISL